MAKEKTTKKSTTGGAKKLSPYNKFMKSELAKVKAEKPTLGHKEAFKEVASRWKDAPENPKNAKITYIDPYTVRLTGEQIPHGNNRPGFPISSRYEERKQKSRGIYSGFNWEQEFQDSKLSKGDAELEAENAAISVKRQEGIVTKLRQNLAKKKDDQIRASNSLRKGIGSYGTLREARKELRAERAILLPEEEVLRQLRQSKYYWNQLFKAAKSNEKETGQAVTDEVARRRNRELKKPANEQVRKELHRISKTENTLTVASTLSEVDRAHAVRRTGSEVLRSFESTRKRQHDLHRQELRTKRTWAKLGSVERLFIKEHAQKEIYAASMDSIAVSSVDGWCDECNTYHIPNDTSAQKFAHLELCPKTLPEVKPVMLIGDSGTGLEGYFLISSRELKRLDSAARSPFLLDRSQQTSYLINVAIRWLQLILDSLSVFLLTTVALLAILQRELANQQIFSIVLSQIGQLTNLMSQLLTASVTNETLVVSVERVREYSQLSPEARDVILDSKTDKAWPQPGQITFNQYSTKDWI
ncbi:hypothetical protein BGZ46_006280 [Entomortierella lignicola]|nr:hypothetical protein BGZ46_006280 [Entomortierella lignicola]